MNKTKIATYQDLLDEKNRLEQLLAVQKQEISSNWVDMKQEFEPVRNVFSFFGKLTTRDKSNPLVNMGIDMAGDLLLRKIILAKTGWATRLVVPFLLKNYSSNVFADKGKAFLHRVKNLVRKNKNGTTEPFHDENGD